MSTRDKSDFGSGKILPEELDDGAAAGEADSDDGVHPERDWATGPDIAAAEAAERAGEGDDDAAAEHRPVQQGAHFRDDPLTRPDEPVDLPHPPKHGGGT